MEKITPRTLSGFMELLPGKQAKMEKLMAVLRNTYSLYGFAPLDTPIIEDAGILLAGGYKVAELTLVDQFSYSDHSELIALFTK